MDCRQRKNIKVGLFVEVVQKPHQKTGELTQGVVAKLLTKSPNHPYGIKVQLESGLVGRVKNIIE
nr:YwbE family protein [Polaribacter reichenbachii]